MQNTKGNDIVIIQDKDLKQSQWKIGLVSEAILGVDGK